MINDNDFRKIINEYGTPSYVFDEDELLDRLVAMRECMSESLATINLCFSIKANPFFIPVLIDAVDNLEVCSPGELEICKSLHVPADKIIYSGVNKDAVDIEAAISYGVAILTAESIKHYNLICDIATKLGKNVNVIPRLSSKSQFGMSIDDIRYILTCNKDNSLVDIVGIHYFAGTQRKNISRQEKELDKLLDIMAQLRAEYDIPLKKLEYGPGLAYPYFADDDFGSTLKPLEDIMPKLSAVASTCELTIEMGRFIASSCGYYMTSIADLKSSYEQNWCILDGGINHVNYLGQMMGMKLPVIKYLADDRGDTDSNTPLDSDWVLCGSLCTTNDVLVKEYHMSSPKIGDVLIFSNLGAYSVTEGIYLFLSRSMPKIIMYSQRNGKCVLARDTVDAWRINC